MTWFEGAYFASTISNSSTLTMKLLGFLPFFALPLAFAATKDIKSQLVSLAATGNGVIRLDASAFDLLTAPNRDWSASIHFTALDKRRRCAPCKCVKGSFACL